MSDRARRYMGTGVEGRDESAHHDSEKSIDQCVLFSRWASIKHRPDWAGSYVRSTHAARFVSRWLGAKTHRIEAWKSIDWLTSMKYCDEYTHCHCC